MSSISRAWALGVSAAALILATPALAQNANPASGNTNAGPGQGGVGPVGARPEPNTSAVPSPAGQPLATGASGNGASGNQIEELVVTAQRREETIQSVPVAVSAFSADALKAQRIDGGQSLLLSVPNVNYSRSNFGGYNFQIRGIGTKLVSNTGDPGVSFNVNTLPVQANHLGDTDFYDVERVEVLRGPQGTLYGRSATGGAVNVITAKPTDRLGGSLTYEAGNFGTNKVTGFVNVPVNDFFQFRLAGFYLNRDGYGTNQYNGHDIDGRDLNSLRASFQLKFNDRLRANFMFEDFNEKDDRNRVGKQLCIKDPGLASVGGIPLNAINRGFTSQGCTPGGLYQDAAYGTLNSQGTLAGVFNTLTGLTTADTFGAHPLQNKNLHDIESVIDPIYQAHERLALLELTWDVTDNLQLSSITGYNRNVGYSIEDYDRVVATGKFNTTPAAGNAFAALGPVYTGIYQRLFPNGVVNDPQIGGYNFPVVYDRSDGTSDEKTQEVRLTSSYKGPLNFSVGGIFINSQVLTNYFVFFNPINGFIQASNAVNTALGAPASTLYGIDNNPIANSSGHNYYDSRYGDTLNSYAGFGEVYWKATDDIRVTAGFRYTVDNKKGNFYPSQLFVAGAAQAQAVHPRATFQEPTGRLNIEWTPKLSFTDQTLVYGTYSHGYKGGGFNTPAQGVNFNSVNGASTFDDELVDAFEVGTKNTLFHGSLVLNATGFFYNYSGYQISSIVNKAAFNSNINAEIYGAELETIWQPVNHLTLNANIGYLHTKVKDAVLTDQAYLTQGDASLTLLKAQDGSNCVVNTAALTNLIAINQGLTTGGLPAATVTSLRSPTALLGACSGSFAAFGLYNYGTSNVQTAAVTQANGSVSNVGQGVLRNLEGNDLPNSPNFTVSLGAQYAIELPGDWKATVRGDFYWQDDSYARIYNTAYDRLKSYENVNATLSFDNAAKGLNVQFFVKNLTDSQPLTDTYLTDASSGLFVNSFTLDPRTYGVSLTKRF